MDYLGFFGYEQRTDYFSDPGEINYGFRKIIIFILISNLGYEYHL